MITRHGCVLVLVLIGLTVVTGPVDAKPAFYGIPKILVGPYTGQPSGQVVVTAQSANTNDKSLSGSGLFAVGTTSGDVVLQELPTISLSATRLTPFVAYIDAENGVWGWIKSLDPKNRATLMSPTCVAGSPTIAGVGGSFTGSLDVVSGLAPESSGPSQAGFFAIVDHEGVGLWQAAMVIKGGYGSATVSQVLSSKHGYFLVLGEFTGLSMTISSNQKTLTTLTSTNPAVPNTFIVMFSFLSPTVYVLEYASIIVSGAVEGLNADMDNYGYLYIAGALTGTVSFSDYRGVRVTETAICTDVFVSSWTVMGSTDTTRFQLNWVKRVSWWSNGVPSYTTSTTMSSREDVATACEVLSANHSIVIVTDAGDSEDVNGNLAIASVFLAPTATDPVGNPTVHVARLPTTEDVVQPFWMAYLDESEAVFDIAFDENLNLMALTQNDWTEALMTGYSPNGDVEFSYFILYPAAAWLTTMTYTLGGMALYNDGTNILSFGSVTFGCANVGTSLAVCHYPFGEGSAGVFATFFEIDWGFANNPPGPGPSPSTTSGAGSGSGKKTSPLAVGVTLALFIFLIVVSACMCYHYRDSLKVKLAEERRRRKMRKGGSRGSSSNRRSRKGSKYAKVGTGPESEDDDNDDGDEDDNHNGRLTPEAAEFGFGEDDDEDGDDSSHGGLPSTSLPPHVPRSSAPPPISLTGSPPSSPQPAAPAAAAVLAGPPSPMPSPSSPLSSVVLPTIAPPPPRSSSSGGIAALGEDQRDSDGARTRAAASPKAGGAVGKKGKGKAGKQKGKAPAEASSKEESRPGGEGEDGEGEPDDRKQKPDALSSV